MFERPKFEKERRNVTLAIPLSSFSSCKVMWRSTSSAAWPGQSVMTSTSTSATSGYASIGRREKETIPAAVKTSTIARVMNRCCSANATIREIMCAPLPPLARRRGVPPDAPIFQEWLGPQRRPSAMWRRRAVGAGRGATGGGQPRGGRGGLGVDEGGDGAPAEDGGGGGRLDPGPDPRRGRGGKKADPRHDRGHDDRPEPDLAAAGDHVARSKSLLPRPADRR